MICAAYRIARSTVYAALGSTPETAVATPFKRGPKTPMTDDALLSEIRSALKGRPFLTEGHRKVRAMLRSKGIRVGRNRVLRLMRDNRLLVPSRECHAHGDRTHSGTIRADRPNELWGTDATQFWTEENGWCWFFGAIDHYTDEIVGWHVAKKGDRWAALEPIRQGIQRHVGTYVSKIALGLGLRHDWGPQYTANQFRAELKWLGIQSSPSFVGEPECNGLIKRFNRTLKEECLYLHRFKSLEEARTVIAKFIETYNTQWMLQRYDYKTPVQVRAAFVQKVAA